MGFLRTMQVRLCTTGEMMVNMVVGENDEKKIGLLMEHCAAKISVVHHLALYDQHKME